MSSKLFPRTLCALLLSIPAVADVVQEQRIVPSPRITSQIYGASLSFDGETIAVGAEFEDFGFIGAGATYIYTRNASLVWVQQARLHGPTLQLGGGFGSAVLVHGDMLLAGSSGFDSGGVGGSGAVYVYARSGTTWTLVGTIEPPNPAADARFGDTIALVDDILAIGSWVSAFPGSGGFGDRLVHIYERVSGAFEYQSTLPAPAAYSTGFAGVADVAASNGRIFAGGSRELAPNGVDAGAVFVYEKVGGVWQQVDTIRIADPPENNDFGGSVAAHGNRVLIGAEEETVNGLIRAGAAYLYEYSGGAWTLHTRLTSDVLDDSDYFGSDVALDGNTIVIGAKQADPLPFVRKGYAKAFHILGDTVSPPLTLTASDGEAHDFFGWRTAVRGDRCVVTAPFESLNRGAAYIYRGVAAPCTPCDTDCNGSINQFDINPFITTLSTHVGCSPCAGDTDGNGTTNQFDINAFIDCLIP